MPTRQYRTALITGASSGIGHALARWFAGRGTRVYAAARRLAPLQALAADSSNVTPVELDIRDASRVRQALREIDDSCGDGGLELVIANAAVAIETPARALRFEDVDEMVNTNVRGTAATLSALLDRMVARGSGHLVGISSLAALRGTPRAGAYCGTKAFITRLLESFRVDLRGTGVLVTAIHPGFVRTPGTAQNTFEMPFILEPDDAAARIGLAIERGARELSFPWQAAAIGSIARALPDWLWDWLAARARPADRP